MFPAQGMWTGSHHHIATGVSVANKTGPSQTSSSNAFHVAEHCSKKNVTRFPDQCYKMVTHLSLLSPRLPASIVSSSGCQSCLVAWFPAVFETREGEMYPYRAPVFLHEFYRPYKHCILLSPIVWAAAVSHTFSLITGQGFELTDLKHTHNKLTSIGL